MPNAIVELLRSKGVDFVDWEGYHLLEAAEVAVDVAAVLVEPGEREPDVDERVLADRDVYAVATHDCDIVNYRRSLLARLIYPVVHPATDFEFNKITIEEMTGGTFTITNGGVFGSMLSTPIINPPQSAILGMHNIIERPVAVKGQVEIRPMMYLAVSYDHRIIDGRESVGFLVAVKEALDNPVEILMGGDERKALEL